MDKRLIYRGSGSDLATDIKAMIPPLELRRLLAELAPVEPPAAGEVDLEACAEWLEQAERTGAYSDMSHPALVAWAKAGYPSHFSGWVCGEIARRLRSLTPPSPAPADLEAADMAEVNDRSRERPSKCRECGGPRNWNGNRPPFCPRCLPPASPPPVSQETRTHSPGVLQSINYAMSVLEMAASEIGAPAREGGKPSSPLTHQLHHAYNGLKAARDFPDLAGEATPDPLEGAGEGRQG